MDPIKYIFEKPALMGRISRWQMALSEYDIVFVTQKAIKGSAVADFLADRALEEYEPLDFEFPDENISIVEEEEVRGNWIMKFDGASNALGHGIGVILISPEGRYYPITAKLCFDCTNNTAEYEACALGMRAAMDMKIKRLEVYGDSALVINQLNGEWETRDEKLLPYREYISDLAKEFEFIKFDHVSRIENQIADALATLAAMFKIDDCGKMPPITIEERGVKAYCSNVEEEEHDGKPWYHDIQMYVKNRTYPPGAIENDKRTIRRLAMNFFLSGDVLYKRNHDSVLLRCVDEKEAHKIIEEVHEGFCGTHMGGHALTRKILRMGYFWLKMEADCIDYVRKCHKCQMYANEIHASPSSLHVMTSPWPFSIWGLDVIGPIEPKASNGNRFILVAIDYFTKWVETESYAAVTTKVVLKFLKRYIVCRYGIPERIITDNARNFNNKAMTEFCKLFKIHHHNSSPYRPQMNGAVEAANRNLKKIIQKMAITYKDWHEMLPYALHGYRTSVRTSTGATPFSLVYGMEAVLPIEVEIPSMRVILEAKLDDVEWVKTRFDQLNFIDEKRLTALCHGQLYQRKLIRAHAKKMKPRTFQEGDLVLKKYSPRQADFRGKWTPKYEGPYVVKKAFSGGALILTNMDGEDLPHPVNADVVKRFYA